MNDLVLNICLNDPSKKNVAKLEHGELYLIHYYDEKADEKRLDVAYYSSLRKQFISMSDGSPVFETADVLGWFKFADYRMKRGTE
jgi:hypothetical protein